MPTLFSDLLPVVRTRLIEPTPKFWADAELYALMFLGARDIWRDVVDLKQEHYLTIDVTNVTLTANSTTLTGVPTDVHKVYMIEPRDLSENGPNHGLSFVPMDYNKLAFQQARSQPPIDPSSDVLFYAIHKQGAPVNAPTILVAPEVTSDVLIAFSYVPTLGTLTSSSAVPIPGEADAAIIAYTVAFARAKERDDRSPDTNWLAYYSNERQHLLQSLGLRQYQEPSFADAVFQDEW